MVDGDRAADDTGTDDDGSPDQLRRQNAAAFDHRAGSRGGAAAAARSRSRGSLRGHADASRHPQPGRCTQPPCQGCPHARAIRARRLGRVAREIEQRPIVFGEDVHRVRSFQVSRAR